MKFRDENFSQRKVFLLGIPHLDWKLVNLMKKYGKFKNFEKLRRNGSYGIICQQQEMCSTPTEFTSMITGVRKEKHSIGYGKESDGEYVKNGRLYTRLDIKSKTIWEIALENGKRVGIYNWLLTWPPTQINGFMVTGRLSQDENRTYPKDLKQFLGEKELESNRFEPEKVIQLIKKYDVDLFLGMDESGHGAIHILWECVEPKNISKKRIEKEREELFKCFEPIDNFLGMLKSEFPNSTIIVVGDSGNRLREYPIYTLGNEMIELFNKLDIGIQLYAYDIYPPHLPKAKPKIYIPGKSPEEKRKIIKALSGIRYRNFNQRFIKNIKWKKDWLSFSFNFQPSWINKKCNWINLTLPNGEDFDIWVIKQTGSAFPKGGVLLANGQYIKENFNIGNVYSIDVAPTILHLLGIQVPSYMDGKIIKEMFKNAA
jgi:hypothetical protein